VEDVFSAVLAFLEVDGMAKRKVLKGMRTAVRKARIGVDDVQENLGKARKSFQAAERRIRTYAKRNPEKAVLIAAGVGAAIGAAITAALKGKR
jgi:ElaB/YqjD/DUF883 family membrane-anchored ribosome-binding protein